MPSSDNSIQALEPALGGMAGAFHMIAIPLPRRLFGALGGSFLPPADRLGGLLEALGDAGRVHLAAGRQDAACRQAVPAPELDRVHADLQGQFVDALLQAGVHFGHPEAAHRTPDRVVGVDAVTVGLHVRDFVGTGAAVAGRAGDVHAVFRVGAAIPVEGVLHGQQFSILVAAHLEVGDQSLAHEGRVELLLAGQEQLDRVALRLGGDRHRQDFHAHAGLAAKSAAHQRGDHAHAALVDAQRLGDQVALCERRLRTVPQGHLARAVHFCDGDMRLERHMLDVRDAVLALDDRRALVPRPCPHRLCGS